MLAQIDDLLTMLEAVSSEAVQIMDGAPEVELEAAIERIAKRGALIAQLHADLPAHSPVPYTVFNRMVVLQHQGAQMEAQLRKLREALDSGLNESQRHQAFANSLSHVLETPQSSHEIDI
jgi:hypothetical protein